MSYSLSDLMQLVVAERGEAVHLHDGEAPVVEIHRELHKIEGPHLEPGDTRTLLRSIAPPDDFQHLLRGCAVFEHQSGAGVCFRVMVFREDDSIRLELRRVL